MRSARTLFFPHRVRQGKKGWGVSIASNLTLLLRKTSEINTLNLCAYISKILFMLEIKSKSKVNCLLIIVVLLQCLVQFSFLCSLTEWVQSSRVNRKVLLQKNLISEPPVNTSVTCLFPCSRCNIL